jgi:hypothetical protein
MNAVMLIDGDFVDVILLYLFLRSVFLNRCVTLDHFQSQ